MIGRVYRISKLVYDEVLSDAEIIAALFCIKSTWPAYIRQVHDKINADYKLKKALETMGQ